MATIFCFLPVQARASGSLLQACRPAKRTPCSFRAKKYRRCWTSIHGWRPAWRNRKGEWVSESFPPARTPKPFPTHGGDLGPSPLRLPDCQSLIDFLLDIGRDRVVWCLEVEFRVLDVRAVRSPDRMPDLLLVELLDIRVCAYSQENVSTRCRRQRKKGRV